MELVIEIGNRHEPKVTNGKNKHKWDAFVRFPSAEFQKYNYKFVKEVRFELHETFKNNIRIVKAKKGSPLELGTVGWGTFDIPITVTFTKESGIVDPLTINHELSFDGNGKWRRIVYNVNKKKILPLLKD